MALEMETDRVICSRCGKTYPKRKGNFKVSYAACHKGLGYLPICGDCIDSMYNTYLAQCNNTRDAVRQMCRKLDLYWNDAAFDTIEKKSTTRTIMSAYMQRINTLAYAGKSYDDTLSNEGTLWSFAGQDASEQPVQLRSHHADGEQEEMEDIPDGVIAFWGSGYTADMYMELEQRRAYLMSRLPDGADIDIGTEALIRQICPLELDINKYRAAGRDVDKLVANLDKLIGSAGLKPGQKKQEDADSTLTNTPLGVWLYRYENKRPLPEIDEELKDVNHIRKYVFTWMGHLCKMLGLKNAYSQLYEDEIARLRVDKPEYDGDDDELLFTEALSDEPTETGE